MQLPEAFLEEMKELLGGEFPAWLASMEEGENDGGSVRGLRVNTLKLSAEEFQTRSPFLLKSVPWTRDGFRIEGGEKASKHPYYAAGLYYLQEPSAMTPAEALPIEEGDRVLDLCAAPGGKTIALAEQMEDKGRLVSCDLTENRVGLIRTAVQRMGLNCVEVFCNDAAKKNPALPQADRILADVPCSGLGILAKKPDIRYKSLDKARRQELLDTQAAILDRAAEYLKPGGRLVYSTCTIHPAENERQIEAFLARRPDFRVELPAERFPEGMTLGAFGALSVPTRTGMDGFFICVMQKNGG